MNEILNLGIIGHGFVGKAVDHGFVKDVNKFIVDPLLGTSIKDLAKIKPKIAFVCVPTPMNRDGTQDSSIVEEVVNSLSKYCPETVIAIKSTATPSVLEKLLKLNERIIFNPEFLREKSANEDFKKSKLIIFGGDPKASKEVSNAYLAHSVCEVKKHIFTDVMSACLIKYSINTFLATKVLFFNEMYDLFQQIAPEENWKELISTLALDERIGPSHMNVPGHDGRKGFGGACFPKDTSALLSEAKSRGINLSVLEQAIKSNNKIRSAYIDLSLREKDQNVFFDT